MIPPVKTSDKRKMISGTITLPLHMGIAFKTQNYDTFAITWKVCEEYVMNVKSTDFCLHAPGSPEDGTKESKNAP